MKNTITEKTGAETIEKKKKSRKSRLKAGDLESLCPSHILVIIKSEVIDDGLTGKHKKCIK